MLVQRRFVNGALVMNLADSVTNRNSWGIADEHLREATQTTSTLPEFQPSGNFTETGRICGSLPNECAFVRELARQLVNDDSAPLANLNLTKW